MSLKITSLKQLKPGDPLTITDPRFPADGKPHVWHFVCDDYTGGGRDIAFVSRTPGNMPDRAIWEWELKTLTIERLRQPVQFHDAFSRCRIGRMLAIWVDHESANREMWTNKPIADTVALLVQLFAPGAHQIQGATLFAHTDEGFEKILTLDNPATSVYRY